MSRSDLYCTTEIKLQATMLLTTIQYTTTASTCYDNFFGFCSLELEVQSRLLDYLPLDQQLLHRFSLLLVGDNDYYISQHIEANESVK